MRKAHLAQKKLLEPVHELFAQMTTRLDALLTTAQREQYEKRTEPAGPKAVEAKPKTAEQKPETPKSDPEASEAKPEAPEKKPTGIKK